MSPGTERDDRSVLHVVSSTPTDLLQTRAQVAAEHKANPVYFHAMEAGLRVTLLHPLQVGFLLEVKVRTPSGINISFIQGELR